MRVAVLVAALCALASEAGAATWECQERPNGIGKSVLSWSDGRSYIEISRMMILQKARSGLITRGAKCTRLQPAVVQCDGQEPANCFDVSPAGMIRPRL